MELGLCGRMQCSNIERVAMSSILPRMARQRLMLSRQRLMLSRQKKRRLGLRKKIFPLIRSFSLHSSHTIFVL